MENTTYRVNVTSPGLTVYFRNRVCRTPVLFEAVHEAELKVLRLQCKQKSITYDFSKNVGDTVKAGLPDDLFDEVVEENDKVIVEELYSKEGTQPESILDKLIAEDK